MLITFQVDSIGKRNLLQEFCTTYVQNFSRHFQWRNLLLWACEIENPSLPLCGDFRRWRFCTLMNLQRWAQASKHPIRAPWKLEFQMAMVQPEKVIELYNYVGSYGILFQAFLFDIIKKCAYINLWSNELHQRIIAEMTGVIY